MPRKSWFESEGAPYPLGAQWIPTQNAFNFAIYSKHATAVSLLFFSEQDLSQPVLTKPLNYLHHKSGRVWHCRLSESELGDVRYYAYQIDGPQVGQGFDLHAFDKDKLLLDPYAKQIVFPKAFDRNAAMRPGSNMGKAPLNVLSRDDNSLDWPEAPAPVHEHDLVIYELHVRGFTRNPNSRVEAGHGGTYLGVIDKIPYLQDFGHYSSRTDACAFSSIRKKAITGATCLSIFSRPILSMPRNPSPGSPGVSADGRRAASGRHRSAPGCCFQPYG